MTTSVNYQDAPKEYFFFGEYYRLIYPVTVEEWNRLEEAYRNGVFNRIDFHLDITLMVEKWLGQDDWYSTIYNGKSLFSLVEEIQHVKLNFRKQFAMLSPGAPCGVGDGLGAKEEGTIEGVIENAGLTKAEFDKIMAKRGNASLRNVVDRQLKAQGFYPDFKGEEGFYVTIRYHLSYWNLAWARFFPISGFYPASCHEDFSTRMGFYAAKHYGDTTGYFPYSWSTVKDRYGNTLRYELTDGLAGTDVKGWIFLPTKEHILRYRRNEEMEIEYAGYCEEGDA
jgi:hypothetical protein